MKRSGNLIVVVGPSGVGKDSLLSGARERLARVHFMQRVITRAADAGGEQHRSVTEDEFISLRDQGALLFHWDAHGLKYGISVDARNLVLNGHTVVFNGSRQALGEQRLLWPELKIIWVTASVELRARRLAMRGREDEAAIARRLATADAQIPRDVIVIENEGSVLEGVDRMEKAIRELACGPQAESCRSF